MKQLLLLTGLSAFLISCQNSTGTTKDAAAKTDAVQQAQDAASDSTNWTTVRWPDSVQNFGKVTDGEKVLINFHVKNTGTKPLIISNVMAGCGCTVPSKPEEPILPGAEGIIKAEFNSSGRVGRADKYVTVTCNTSARTYTLKFEGDVLAKKETTNTNNK
jgi:Protein of unknown function (DUF1573)